MQVEAIGNAAESTPSLTNGYVKLGKSKITSLYFRVEQQGVSGSVHWFVGRENGRRVAAAFEPTPRGVAPSKDRWSVFDITLADQAAPANGGQPTTSLRHACTAERDKLNFVSSAIKGIRVEPGAP
jgi:hypothetical protein